ncbi:MAG TPA: MFS transporter, partial [Patescibacteria group bacterium]
MKTFYHLLFNNLIAGIVNFTVWFGITFYTFLQTQSVFATSIISGLYLVSTAISSIWFGSLVDHNRKKVVMLASSVISLIAYSLSFAVYVTADPAAFTQVSSVTLWLLISVVMAGVLAGNLRNIALPTIVTLLVAADQRDRANGMVGMVSGIGFMVTSMISGFLVGHSGMYLVLLLAIVATMVAIIHLFFIPVTEKEIVHTEGATSKIDIKGTIKVVAAVPGLFALIFFTTFN